MFSIWVATSRSCRRGARLCLNHRLPLLTDTRSCRLLSQFRSQSTSAAVQKSSPAPASAPPSSDSPGAQNEVLDADLPSWTSLEGRLSERTLKAITGHPYRYEKMTKVQAEVLNQLPGLISPHDPEDPDPPPRDLLVRARTGTGKTLAFLIPAVEARLKAIEDVGKQAVIDAGLDQPNHRLSERARTGFTHSTAGVLIISPTRELATQIANEAMKVTKQHAGFEVRLFVGGMSKRMQMNVWLKGRKDIVVGTPGRLRDVLENEPEVARAMSKTPILVLDEADTLLDLGFREDIEAIKKFLPASPERQTFLFSATVSPAVRQVARSFLAPNHSYVNCVSGSDPSPVHEHVPQYHTVLPSASHQLPFLLRLLAHDQLSNPGKSKTIVFLPTTKMTQLFSNVLRSASRDTLPAGKNTRIYELHSKRAQESRSRTSDQFRRDTAGASILVTSDVSARGVDYPGVTRVIQVGIPSGGEQYVHRVGRTGRGGRTDGRGDLILLPWETGFVTWELTKVPLKPLTSNDLTSQLNDLAAKFDSNPSEFHGRHSRGSQLFSHNRLTPIFEEIDRRVSDTLSELDKRDIEETFMSLLGFYTSKFQELRTKKSVIVDGCKEWCTEGMGLDEAPFLSRAFLDRLGFTDREPKPSAGGYGWRSGSRDSGSRGSGSRGSGSWGSGSRHSGYRGSSSSGGSWEGGSSSGRSHSHSRPWDRRGTQTHRHRSDGSGRARDF